MKKFVLNADDLAKSEFHNNAVLKAFKEGFLKSASIMANMPFYKDAVHRVVLPNPELGVGIHLNIVEGKALGENLNLLCDKNNNFNNGFLSILLKSYNDSFLEQTETEFRRQIEFAQKDINLTHIDSHVHIHGIPRIFELTSKLALEYNIKQIRTQAEIPYYIFGKKNNPANFLKILILNYFTLKNKQTVKKYNLKTNDYLIGISYSGNMDSDTILEGLKKIKSKSNVEALIHPCLYYDNTVNSHTKEFKITVDKMLEDLIENLGYEISNYIN